MLGTLNDFQPIPFFDTLTIYWGLHTSHSGRFEIFTGDELWL